VEFLLGHGNVDPDKQEIYDRTAVEATAWKGHEGVPKILLGREEANPDKSPNSDKALLSWVLTRGERVVRVLLTCKQVDPEKSNIGGQAPLLGATRAAHKGVVQVLCWHGGVGLPTVPCVCLGVSTAKTTTHRPCF